MKAQSGFRARPEVSPPTALNEVQFTLRETFVPTNENTGK
jgi:hypothetical protein